MKGLKLTEKSEQSELQSISLKMELLNFGSCIIHLASYTLFCPNCSKLLKMWLRYVDYEGLDNKEC